MCIVLFENISKQEDTEIENYSGCTGDDCL